jgi:hypothetical protein
LAACIAALSPPGPDPTIAKSYAAATPRNYTGARSLVSTRGESDWVKNLRAAGAASSRAGAAPTASRPTRSRVDWRAPVLRAYRKKAGREVQRDFDRLPDPADHPVFLVDVEAGRSQSATAGS